MRLFHFSEDSNIVAFRPQPVAIPHRRSPGFDWLNGALVWAIEEDWDALYLFPRDCPRILIRSVPTTCEEDRLEWFGHRSCRMIAHIEWAWLERLCTTTLYRYELPVRSFEDLEDAGMWVSKSEVVPMNRTEIDHLPAALSSRGVELRVMDSLAPLRHVWRSTLHASGIRLRNARSGPC